MVRNWFLVGIVKIFREFAVDVNLVGLIKERSCDSFEFIRRVIHILKPQVADSGLVGLAMTNVRERHSESRPSIIGQEFARSSSPEFHAVHVAVPGNCLIKGIPSETREQRRNENRIDTNL